ncbi:MAG TPA: hypothetical protein VGL83_06130 [Stellaceae bacterium]
MLQSEFNDFLFAPVGDQSDPQTPTVLSAFSREGIDPWQQAAKLRQLPKELAARNLASILAALPDRPRSVSEAQLAADRLIALLPGRPSLKLRLALAARAIQTGFARAVFHRSR